MDSFLKRDGSQRKRVVRWEAFGCAQVSIFDRFKCAFSNNWQSPSRSKSTFSSVEGI